MDEFIANDRELLFDHIEEAETLCDRLAGLVRQYVGYGSQSGALEDYDSHRARYPRASVGERVS